MSGNDGASDSGLDLLLVAPLAGDASGRIPDVFETLGPLLAAEGHHVEMVSTEAGRWRRALDMLKTARRRRPDIAIIHLYSGQAAVIELAVAAVARRRAARLVGVLAGGGFPEFAQRHPRLTRSLLGRIDHLVAPSAYLARWAATVVDVPTTVIPNPLDVSGYPFRIRTKVEPRILWLRAYHEIYEPLVAVGAVEALLRDGIDTHLTMAGADKGRKAEVEAAVRRRGLEDHVTVLGFVSGPDKVSLFDASDVFLNTSRVDNRPVSVVEAAACGLCVVSTDVGGIPELVHDGEDALLVPAGDVDGLARAVRSLCDDPARASRLSAAGRVLADGGSPDRVLGAWRDLLANG